MVGPSVPIELYPIAIVEDRYQGTYSGGPWLALANADELHNGVSRATFVLENGPRGEDLEAASFWAKPPSWIAAGATPDDALAALMAALNGED